MYPKSWGGTAKYNLTRDDMSDKTCSTLYGFPTSFQELVYLLTHCFFPDMEVKKTAMTFGTPLSDFEKALATIQFFKTGEDVGEVAHHWGVKRRRMGVYLKTWSARWKKVSLVSVCVPHASLIHHTHHHTHPTHTHCRYSAGWTRIARCLTSHNQRVSTTP